MNRTLTFAAPCIMLLATGCAHHVTLNEISRSDAKRFRTDYQLLDNPALYTGRTDYGPVTEGALFSSILKEPAPARTETDSTETPDEGGSLWIQVPAAAALFANDIHIELFEEGAIRGTLPTGEVLKGNYLGYRSRGREHCTRSSLSNLSYLGSRGGSFKMQGGLAVLKAGQGTSMYCAYGWLGPKCQRQGICATRQGQYYKMKF